MACCRRPAPIRPSLVLEVTESALMDDPAAADVLQALRGLGVRFALDDFGTGYSSLTYLKRFPIDAIKIDRSFVGGLGRDGDDEAIVASVASLGRAIGKSVVAEGVETSAQLEVLRGLGVDRAQGFLWSPALPAEQLERWLAHRPGPSSRVPRPSRTVPHRRRPRPGADDLRSRRRASVGPRRRHDAAAARPRGVAPHDRCRAQRRGTPDAGRPSVDHDDGGPGGRRSDPVAGLSRADLPDSRPPAGLAQW